MEKIEILDSALNDLHSKLDKPFTFQEWKERLKPLALIPLNSKDNPVKICDHIDLEEYHEMCYNTYYKDFYDNNLRYYHTKKETIDCLKKAFLPKPKNF